VINLDGVKAPFESVTIKSRSLKKSTGQIRLAIEVLPTSSLVWLGVGLKDLVGAPLEQDKFPVHDNLLLLSDAFDASLRSMSLNGKLPKKLIKLCEDAAAAPPAKAESVTAVVEEAVDYLWYALNEPG